jgi:hypothetical protein
MSQSGNTSGRQAGAPQLVAREPTLERLRCEAVPGREPEPELPRDVLSEATLFEVRPHGPAAVALPQQPLEVGRRLLEERVEALAVLSLRVDPRGRLLVLDPDAEALRQPFHGADEVDALRFADEGDHVTAAAAAEAVVELLERVDREARRPLLVERAAPREPLARRAPERSACGDDLDDVRRRDHVAHRVILDPRHGSRLLGAHVVLF